MPVCVDHHADGGTRRYSLPCVPAARVAPAEFAFVHVRLYLSPIADREQALARKKPHCHAPLEAGRPLRFAKPKTATRMGSGNDSEFVMPGGLGLAGSRGTGTWPPQRGNPPTRERGESELDQRTHVGRPNVAGSHASLWRLSAGATAAGKPSRQPCTPQTSASLHASFGTETLDIDRGSKWGQAGDKQRIRSR